MGYALDRSWFQWAHMSQYDRTFIMTNSVHSKGGTGIFVSNFPQVVTDESTEALLKCVLWYILFIKTNG